MKLRLSCAALFLVPLALGASAQAAEAPADVQEVLAVFESTCLENLRRTDAVSTVMSDAGATALAPKAADGLLAPHKGKAWVLQSVTMKGENTIITLTDKGTCSVSARHADGNAVTKLLEDNFRNTKIRDEQRPASVTRVYALSHDENGIDGDAHALIVAAQGGPSGAEGVILSAVPEATLVKSGTATPDWPK